MPSTLVLNADQNTCPALGTWVSNNTKILSGFSLLIAEDILQQIGTQESLKHLSITPCQSICKGGDIAMAAKILQGEISALIHFPAPPEVQANSVLTEPLIRAALLNDLPIALNPASATGLLQGIKRSRRGYLIFNPVSGQGDPDIELAEIRRYLEPQFMLQIWKTQPGLDPAHISWLASLQFGFIELDCGLIHGSSADVGDPLKDTTSPLILLDRLTRLDVNRLFTARSGQQFRLQLTGGQIQSKVKDPTGEQQREQAVPKRSVIGIGSGENYTLYDPASDRVEFLSVTVRSRLSNLGFG